MQRKHIIALDTHGQDSEVVVTTGTGRLTRRERCPTTIPTLTEVIRSVRRPRERVFEEGPLADGCATWWTRSWCAIRGGII